MWPHLIVPPAIGEQLLSEIVDSKWYQDSSSALVLQRKNESLSDGNRAMLTDGSEAGFDAAGCAPILIGFPELHALVRDDVLRPLLDGRHDNIEPRSDIIRLRPILEDLDRNGLA